MLGRRRACRAVQAVQAVRGVGRSCGGGRGIWWVVVGGEGGGVVVGGGGAGGGGYELGGGGSSFCLCFCFVLGLIRGVDTSRCWCQLGDDNREGLVGWKKIKIT